MRSKMGIKGVHIAAFAATVGCLWALAMPAVAAQPGMTVKIPARQDVDKVYILAAVHQKHCSLLVGGKVLGHRFKGFRKSSVSIHLTNQAFLRLSSSDKRAVKRAIHKGRTVKARVTVTARNSSGSRNSVTRSVTLTD